MSTPENIPNFWTRYGPLSSLSCAVLLIGATSRLSYALIVFSSVLFVYALTPLCLRAASRFIPSTHRPWIHVVFASAAAAVFARVAGIAWPVLVRELALYLGMVPLCLIASGLLDSDDSESALRSLKKSLSEAFILAALAIALALIREPFGFGTLSLPSSGGIVALFAHETASALAVRSLASTGGAFIILGYVLALYRRIRFRRFGTPLCGEDEV